MSKTIRNHPAVEECLRGTETGHDRKYDVFLAEGWVFSHGVYEGIRQGFFDTVAEFNHAKPVRVEPVQQDAEPTIEPVQQAQPAQPTKPAAAKPAVPVKLSKGQRRRRNKAWRKAGLFGKTSTAERKARAAVDKRVKLADLMACKDAGQRMVARKEYKRISGEYSKPSMDVRGFWNPNAARGRTKAVTVPVN